MNKQKELLDKGYSKTEARDEIRDAARDEVQSEIENILTRWRGPVGS